MSRLWLTTQKAVWLLAALIWAAVVFKYCGVF